MLASGLSREPEGAQRAPLGPVATKALICGTCESRTCCYHYRVNITGLDMWRISRTLDLAPERVVACWNERHDDRAAVRREWREARVASRQSPLAPGAVRGVRAGGLGPFVGELRELLAEYAPPPPATAADVASPTPRETAARTAV